MHIIERNPNLKYTRDIQQEKRLIVLSWLLEFQFSSPRILARLLAQPQTSTSRFFAKLLEQRFIRTFDNVHTNRERLFMLDRNGVESLMVREIDTSKACINPHVLSRSSSILHDQDVQLCIIHQLDQYTEVVCGKNRPQIDADAHPNALVKSTKGHWIALVYERYRKSSSRINHLFYRYAQGIAQGHYHGICWYFYSHKDMLFYKKIFDSDRWPVVSKNPKTGKLIPTDKDYMPAEIQHLRSRFSFAVLDDDMAM